MTAVQRYVYVNYN